MTKTRLITLLLALALALAVAPAVLAQDESPPAEGDAMSEDLGPFEDVEQLEAAQGFYADYAEAMEGMGIVGESLDFSSDWLREWYAGEPDMDVDEAEAEEEVAEEMGEAEEEIEEEKEEAIEQASD